MNTRVSVCVALIGVLTVSACAYQSETTSPSCPAVEVDRDGWQVARAEHFTFQVPPEYREEEIRGTDSEVGEWRSGDRSISYDYGWYSNPLDQITEPHDVCVREIGGYRARVVTFRREDGRYVAAAHWPDVGRGDNRLTIYGSGSDPAAQRQFLGIIQSVRFER